MVNKIEQIQMFVINVKLADKILLFRALMNMWVCVGDDNQLK